MNIFLRSFAEIFKSKLAFVFLSANLFICGFALKWNKVFSYINEHEKKHNQVVFSGNSSQQISFGTDCYFSRQILPDEILVGSFYFISFPSLLGAELFINDLKKSQPDWCKETFEVLEIIVFLIFNSLYLFLIGVFIEQFYEKYHTIPLTKEKYLNL